MANTKSAAKAARRITRQTIVNKARRTRMRTEVRRVEEAIESGDKQAAMTAMKAAEPVLAKAAQNGIVHRNAASRKVSRLTARITQLA